MVNDEIEYNEIHFSIEIDVFKDKKEKNEWICFHSTNTRRSNGKRV